MTRWSIQGWPRLPHVPRDPAPSHTWFEVRQQDSPSDEPRRIWTGATLAEARAQLPPDAVIDPFHNKFDRYGYEKYSD